MKRRQFLGFTAVSAAFVLAACGNPKPGIVPLKADAHILALGDSLTAGVGTTPDQAWPAKLAQLTGWQLDNEGLSGDTSTGALQRLSELLASNNYDAVLIGIGGNDMLRGVSQQTTRDNLAAMIRQARAHTQYVAVIATPAPDALRAAISSLSDAPFYEEIATVEQALLIPTVYADVLSDASLRSDRIHANAQGYAIVAEQLANRLKAAGWR